VTGPVDAVIARVDGALAAFLDGRARALQALGADLEPLGEAARRCVLDGGKRLRPMFAYWGWRTVRGPDDDDGPLVIVAAAVELLHACALVHDDVMDASATRRGRPSAHTAFARMHADARWSGDPVVFGTAAAILLGDLLLSWADALFATAGIDGGGAARRVFDEMRQLVMAGQYLDVLSQAQGAFSADDALRVIELKTGKYTVEGPLHLGAAMGGAGPDVFDALSRYGVPLGEAFQLRDDVLGVFGVPAETGKPAGDDLREGKHTLLTALAMDRADAGQAETLRRGLGDRSLDEHEVGRLRSVIVATGALAQVERRIAERAAQARAALGGPVLSRPARSALDALAGAATVRRS
jgi:geranylgeranyl diphosphate synthase type I